MKNLAWIPGSVVVACLVYVAACSSKSSNGSNTGGTSGGGTITGPGACVFYVDDAGNSTGSGTAAECYVTSIDGTNNSGPPCPTGSTYATSCPTQGLIGCCTIRGNSDSTTVVLIDTCMYSDLLGTAAQQEAACVTPLEDGGLPGTWSTSPPQ